LLLPRSYLLTVPPLCGLKVAGSAPFRLIPFRLIPFPNPNPNPIPNPNSIPNPNPIPNLNPNPRLGAVGLGEMGLGKMGGHQSSYMLLRPH